ncbi:hypothetical protein Pecwa_0376 [Pectobacterium parmentieri WPP163]|nr:hypothetical protein Pecwa_0376 [Pectobacterium parmentieri WPP163]
MKISAICGMGTRSPKCSMTATANLSHAATGYNGWELLVQQRQNAAGKLYVTDALMSPNDIMRYLLITDPLHAGRGDYAIIFKADSVQMSNIKRSSMLEYIHSGKIKSNDVLYSGSNPYSITSNMNYEARNNLTLNQINMRGKYGVRK